MGYNNSSSKQQNTYIGETGTQYPLIQLANQLSRYANQKQAQQNLLFGGEGYGGAFQSQDQRNWDPNSGQRYPDSKPYGGWGQPGGYRGYGADNPVSNPASRPPVPSWPGMGQPGDGSASSYKATVAESQTPKAIDPNTSEQTIGTMQGVPNVATGQAASGTFEALRQQRVAEQGRSNIAAQGAPGGGEGIYNGPDTWSPTAANYDRAVDQLISRYQNAVNRFGGGTADEARDWAINKMVNPFAQEAVPKWVQDAAGGTGNTPARVNPTYGFDPSKPGWGSQAPTPVQGAPGYAQAAPGDTDPSLWINAYKKYRGW